MDIFTFMLSIKKISSEILFLLQLHIAFCVFAAVAPPVVFKGKSLA
jgi:hypothetical protein